MRVIAGLAGLRQRLAAHPSGSESFSQLLAGFSLPVGWLLASGKKGAAKSVLAVTCLLLLASCRSAAPTSVAEAPSAQAKILATVYISPTPDAAQLQATSAAASPTPTAPPVTPSPEATVYVGVFLGSADAGDNAPIPIGPTPGFDITAEAATGFTGCPQLPDDRFGTLWQANGDASAALGCPADIAIPYSGTTQVFEHGVMYFTPDGAIWAISPGNPSGLYWYADHAPDVPDDSLLPPNGLRVPVFGFGAFWRGVPGVRDALGFATTDETSITFVVQAFQSGALLHDGGAGQTFILSGGSSGSAYGPY